MDVAVLGLRVESGQVAAAKTELDKMGQAGDAAGAKVSNAASRIRRDLAATTAAARDLAAAYRAGAIGETRFMSENSRLDKQADDLRRSLVQAERATVSLDTAAKAAGPSLRGLREPLTSLAANAAGLDPRLASVTSQLALFGAGSGLVLAITAGIAAIGAVFGKVGRDAETLRDSVRGLGDAFAALQGLEAEKRYQTATLDFLAAADDLKAARASIFRSDAAALAAYNDALAELLLATGAMQDKRDREPERIRREAEAWGDLSGQVRAATAALEQNYAAWRQRLDAPVLFTRSSVLPQREAVGPGADDIARMVDEALRRIKVALPSVLAGSRGVAESWADSARSGLQLVQALGGANDSMLLLLHNAVSVGEQLEQAAQVLKAGGGLTSGNVLGILSGVAGVFTSLAGLLGESPEERRRAEVHLQNIERILDLIRQEGGFGILGGTAASTTLGVQRALTGLGSPGPGGAFLEMRLAQQGLGLNDLREVAEGLGISFAHAIPTAQELRDVLEAIAAADLTQFRQTFTGQLGLLQDTFELMDITDPVQKLQQLVSLLGRPDVGAPAFGGQLSQFDLTTVQGRALAEAFIQQQFRRFNLAPGAGGFTLEELGGLSPEQLRDYFLTFESLLDQANESLGGVVDALRDFRDSLALDPALSTLSPVQKLVEARRQYDAVLALAQSGDATAAGQLPEVARALLEASRAVNASGPAYAADYARVMRDTEALEALFGELSGTNETIAKYSGEMANNTATTVTRLEDLIAVQQVGMQSLIDQLDGLRTEMAENTRAVKLGFEGAALN